MVRPFDALIGLVCVERIAELVVSRQNTRWSADRGGVEHGAGHYPVMVVLHTLLIAGCLIEPRLVPRESALSIPALGVVVAAQALRWWVIRTLGPRWNTRVIVVPGLPLVRTGPFRWFAHPNYVAVIAEGVALPLVGGAWMTAVGFTLLNAALLTVRVRVENQALRG